MMRLSLSALAVLLPLLAVLVAQLPAVEARNRWCIPHGYDNRWAPKLGKGNMECYHHWQDGPVDQYSKHIEYVPMMWDLNRHGGLWAQRKRQMKNNLPRRILAQNEPDVKGQANLDPITAAKDWVRELKPYQDKGVKISSPQIVYDLDWMDKFMTKLHQLGADVDFMAIHSYTPKGDKGLNQLKTFVQKVRKRYGKSIWVTEYGITAASNPSSAEVKDYVIKAQKWMDSTSYVKRSFPLGGFAVTQPPDAFVTNKMAFFSGNGQLRSVANWLVYSGKSRRDVGSLPSSPLEHRAAASPGAKRHHAKLASRAAARDQVDADLLEARDEDDADADEKDGGEELPCTDADPYCGLGDKIAKQLETLVDGDWYESPEDRDDDEEDID